MSTKLHPLLRRLLRPAIRFCLRRSLKIQEVVAALKEEFIELATDQLEQEDVEVSVSKLSAATGLQRKDLSRLIEERSTRRQRSSKASLITRLIGQWTTDRRFRDRKGAPRALTTQGLDSEFAHLVRALSSDLNHHTVLFELERLQYVRRTNTTVELQASAHVDRGDSTEALHSAAQDIDDLYRAVEENLGGLEVSDPHLQARTFFDNIPPSKVPQLKQRLRRLGGRYHREVRALLSRYDRDINGSADDGEAGRVRIVFGTFAFAEVEDSGKKNKRKAPSDDS